MHFQGFVNFLTVLKVLVAQSCLIFCNPVACSLPGSSVHGIFQARALAWVVIPYSRDLPDPGIEPRSPTLQADSLLSEPPESPPLCKLLKIMRKLGSLGKLQKPFWLLCYGVSAWLQISMACFSLLVLLHFCSPFLFLGGCNFSTICADFPWFQSFSPGCRCSLFFQLLPTGLSAHAGWHWWLVPSLPEVHAAPWFIFNSWLSSPWEGLFISLWKPSCVGGKGIGFLA